MFSNRIPLFLTDAKIQKKEMPTKGDRCPVFMKAVFASTIVSLQIDYSRLQNRLQSIGKLTAVDFGNRFDSSI